MIDSLLACSPQAAYRATALQQRPLSSSIGLDVVGVDHEALCLPTLKTRRSPADRTNPRDFLYPQTSLGVL